MLNKTRVLWIICLAGPVPLIPACLGNGDPRFAGVPSKPAFNKNIAPIVEKHCLGCHQAGGIGSIALETYDDFKAHAASIDYQVQNRLMPPYNVNNDGSCRTFKNARWLSDAEIETMRRWVTNGAPAGEPITLKAPLQSGLTNTKTFITPSFTPSIKPDHYRCFVLDPQLATDQFLTAIAVTPKAIENAHHMLLYTLETPAAISNAVEQDLADDGPGYTCQALGNLDIFVSGESHLIAGWAPGVGVTYFPANTGTRIPAGAKLLVEMHYNTLNAPREDATRLDLQLADSVKFEAYTALIDDFELVVPAGQTAATYTVNIDLGLIYNRLYFQGSPDNVTIRGVFPHMHQRGVRQKMTAVGKNGEVCLHNTDRWDFDWQEFFFYDYGQEVTLAGDETLKVECTFNTTDLTQPLEWGEGTGDEMCLTILYYTRND